MIKFGCRTQMIDKIRRFHKLQMIIVRGPQDVATHPQKVEYDELWNELGGIDLIGFLLEEIDTLKTEIRGQL